VRVPGPGGVGRFIPESEAAAAAKAAGVPIAKRRDARDAETERRLSPPPVGPAPSPEEEDKRTDVTSDGPSGETSETSGAEKEKSPLSYADWMRSVTTMAVEMEVNAQLGEFTVRKNRLKSLQRSVREMPDFTAALGATLAAHGAAEKRSKRANRRAGGDRGGDRVDKAVAGAATAAAALDDSDDDDSDDDDAGEIVVHCAEVRRSKHRLWMRLVGLRHDVQLWDRDRRAPQNPFVRPYAPLFTNAQIAAGLAGAAGAVSSAVAAAGAAGLRGAERWISERLDPVVAGPAAEYLQGVELFMPLATVDGPVARLAGFAKLPEDPGGAGDKAWGFEPGARGDGETGDVTGATDPEKKKTTGKEETDGVKNRVGALTEVVVLRDPPLVQVYRVESYGRRFRRALVFASQAAWCLADIDPDGHPALSDSGERYLLSAARLGAAASSLVVSRHLNENQGRQQFVPARHLRGLLPAALLEEYAFWQSGDGDLYGDAKHNAKHPRTMIHCRLLESDGDGTGVAGERAAVIRRIPLPPGCEPGTSVRVPEGVVPGQLTLVDLLYAPAILAAPDAKRDETSGDDAKTSRDAVAEAATALKSLAGRLAAVEGLAHCLAWTAAPVDVDKLSRQGGVLGALRGAAAAVVGAMAAAAETKRGAAADPPRASRDWSVCGIDRLELPRLGISFSRGGSKKRAFSSPVPGDAKTKGNARDDESHTQKLECEEHAGLFLSARRSPALDALLSGLPHALVLEARDGDLKVLLPAGAAPRPALDRVVEVSEEDSGAPGAKQKRGPSTTKDLAVVAAEEGLPRWAPRGSAPTPCSTAGTTRGSETQTRLAAGTTCTRCTARTPCSRRPASRRRSTCVCFGSWRAATRTCANSLICASASRSRPRRRRSCGRRSPALRTIRRRTRAPRGCVCRWRRSGRPPKRSCAGTSSPSSRRTSPRGATSARRAACPPTRSASYWTRARRRRSSRPCSPTAPPYLYLRSRVDERVAVGHPDAPKTVSEKIVSQNGASTAACPLVYPDLPPHSVFDLVDDRSCLEEGVTGDGPLGKLAGLTHSFTQYEAKDVTGAAGLQKVGEWLDAAGGAFFALDSAYGFPTLFELLTGSTPLRVLPTDDPHRWGCALLRFVPPEHATRRGTLMSTLRVLASSKRVAEAAPKVEERGVGARMAAVFAQDGAIGLLLRRVQPFLRERAAGAGGIPPSFASRWASRRFTPPDMVAVPERGGVFGTPRDAARWALPKFPNAACRGARSRLASPTSPRARGRWGGPNLDAVRRRRRSSTAPLAQLGLEKFFVFEDGEDDDEDGDERGLDDGEPMELPVQPSRSTPPRRRPSRSARWRRLRRTYRRRRTRRRRRKPRRAREPTPRRRDVGGRRRGRRSPYRTRRTSSGPRGGARHGGGARSRARLASVSSGDSSGDQGSCPATVKARGALVAVLRALRDLAARDRAAATEAAAAATSTANGLSRDPSAARAMLRLGLNRRSGAWAEATFDDLVEGLLCSDGEKILARLTPGVGEAGAAAALHLAAEALLLTSRATLASRAAAAAEDAIAAVDGAAETVASAASERLASRRASSGSRWRRRLWRTCCARGATTSTKSPRRETTRPTRPRRPSSAATVIRRATTTRACWFSSTRAA
jgi:hypothetical protein